MNTDEGIRAELRAYNPLISRPGKLSATLFLELTTDEQLREWLPKLVGIERHYEIHLGTGDDVDIIAAQVDAGHDSTLTREETTASVHYLWWPFTTEQAEKLANGPAESCAPIRPTSEVTELTDINRASLSADLL
ncbi:MAG: DUF3501 family protein [Acidimicrobiales bacterium]